MVVGGAVRENVPMLIQHGVLDLYDKPSLLGLCSLKARTRAKKESGIGCHDFH